MSLGNQFNHYLGIEIMSTEPDRCVVKLPIRDELCNSLKGVVHGGVTSTLVDVAMGHAAAPPVNGVQQCVTIESKIHYLRPAKGAFLQAESKVLQRGEKIIFMEATVTNDQGILVAIASGTYARVNVNRYIEQNSSKEQGANRAKSK